MLGVTYPLWSFEIISILNINRNFVYHANVFFTNKNKMKEEMKMKEKNPWNIEFMEMNL